MKPALPSPAPLWIPALLVLVGTLGLGALSIANTRAMSPTWGQDLAFFTQLVHRASQGGPWASPLLLEPQGFFEMVHTHIVLPLVVGSYRLLPRQELLLLWQALFACLALWPAFRLGEQVGRLRGGLLSALGLLAFGPFQAVAIADFRPSALFIPGLLGVFAAARQGRSLQAVGWALVANLGRQEGAWLSLLAGGALLLSPWGLPPRQAGEALGRWLLRGLKWRPALALLVFSALALGAWLLLKPQMLFHLNPLNPAPAAVLPPDIAEQRVQWLLRLLCSGGIFGLLAPTPLLAAAPVFREMARTGREWGPLTGPAAHYGAFWVPFVAAAGIAGAGRLHRRFGPLAFAALCALSFPWVSLREGPVALRRLTAQVGPEERVAADYDVIFDVAAREVLWNVAWLSMTESDRPHGWTAAWPIALNEVDVLILKESDPLAPVAEGAGWQVVDREDQHLLMRRSAGD